VKKKKSKNKLVIGELKNSNLQILQHLKMLGDDIIHRRQSKEQKREIKYQLQKRAEQNHNDASDEEQDERPIIIEVPRYTRRRVQFNNN
jgi:formamidopyrimidine-DNA glycosylase